MGVSTFTPQLKSDTSSIGQFKGQQGRVSVKKKVKKRDDKKLRKLKPDLKYDEFLSVKSSQSSYINNLVCSQ